MSLGSFSFTHTLFPHLDQIFTEFHQSDFTKMSARKRFRKVNEVLLELIQKAEDGTFLLTAVLDFIDRVNREKLFDETYRFSLFEFYLNRFSGLGEDEKHAIRGKIVGKLLPRQAYQTYFPIGMDKSYSGSHFVSAHLSPDVDTTIASFWGWIDALGAKVGTGQHVWCLPGGAPDSHISMLFRELFGQSVFAYLARPTNTLTLSAMDLLTDKATERYTGEHSTFDIDHGTGEKAIIYVDEKGHYLGDFRSTDVEQVRLITNMFKSTLHWFENNFHVQLISLFAKENLKNSDLKPFYKAIFETKLSKSGPISEFTVDQKELYRQFLEEVVGVEKGLEATFNELLQVLGVLGVINAPSFYKEVTELDRSDLFDTSGKIKEQRPQIFNHLEAIIKVLDQAIQEARAYVERLDVVMGVKHKVLKFQPQYMLLRSGVEEIRSKMGNFEYLTVVVPEEKGSYYPVGVVRASDLRKPVLGTVSIRDFSNFNEMKMASYLQVISVVDHHKIDLKTLSAPQVIVGDAQSCNVIVAELAFNINDTYGLGGMTPELIEKEIKRVSKEPAAGKNLRILQRLLQKQRVVHHGKGFWVTPEREYAEYQSFLYAILDDTDLLSKVTPRDVDCVGNLLNRMKSLSTARVEEIIDFSDIPRDSNYAKVAADRILKNDEMYSFSKKIYEFKEQEVEANILLCSQGLSSNFFIDTKEQNGCCRVGQAKMFVTNVPTYLENRDLLRKIWLKGAENRFENAPEIDLHMQMISTIPSADEVHGDLDKGYSHQDEIWFWIPETAQGPVHLAQFLAQFQNAPEIQSNQMELEFLGGQSALYAQIFARNFISIPTKTSKGGLPIAVLRYTPGTINSRKSMITPYLPRVIS